MKRRLLSIFISALMLLACMPLAPAAELRTEYNGACGDNMTWYLNTENGALIINGTGEMYNFSSAPWYAYRSSITSAEIFPGVTGIGRNAFYDCSNMTSVTVPEGIVSIGDSAFANCCALAALDIPQSVTSIGYGAFRSCSSLVSLAIPDGVTELCYLFDYCDSLQEVTIGSGVYDMYPQDWFTHCPSIQNVFISEDNPYLSSIGGVVFSKDGRSLFYFPAGRSVDVYNIPIGTVCVEERAFYNCSIGRVTIPDSVRGIGQCAFQGCGISAVYIPSSVENIDVAAFDLNGLGKVIFGEGVKNIGREAFHGIGISSVVFPVSLESMGFCSFSSCRNLRTAIFLGPPPASFDTTAFEYAAFGFTIYYTPQYANLWAPNGETVWNGYSIKLITDDYPDWAPPAAYDDGDLTKLLYYLEQPSAVEGKKNGEALYENYDPADPATYAEHYDDPGHNTWRFVWSDETYYREPKRLTGFEAINHDELAGPIELAGCESLLTLSVYLCPGVTNVEASGCTSLIDCNANGISGTLDLSGCTAMETLDCIDIGMLDVSGCTGLYYLWCEGVDAIDVSDCPALGILACMNSELSEIDLTGCPDLREFVCTGVKVREFELACCPNLGVNTVRAEGRGYVGVSSQRWFGDTEELIVEAVPEEGEDFLGWYTSGGEYISNLIDLDLVGSGMTELTARFTGPYMFPGDMDGDGQLTFNDVSLLYIALIGSDQLEQLNGDVNGDVNGDGNTTFADVTELCLFLLG